MTSLPRISGRDCVEALLKKGFQFKRQNGSHIILRRADPFGQVVVPITKNWTVAHFAESFDRQV